MLGAGFLAGITGCISSNKSYDTTKDSADINIDPTDSDSGTSQADSSDTHSENTQECLSSSMQLSLTAYPHLKTIGGSAIISFPDDFAYILIVCVGLQDWIGVWKICTHGNCDVEWAEDLELIRCPCHNSLFDWDGTVLQGPATRGLASFTVCLDEDGDTLNISRLPA